MCPRPRSAKSTVAAEAAQAINPALRVRALQNRVSPDTEDVFDDAFWSQLDVVVRAVQPHWRVHAVAALCRWLERGHGKAGPRKRSGSQMTDISVMPSSSPS